MECIMDKAAGNHTPVPLVSLLHNLSIGQVIDQLGHAKAETAEAKAREDALKAELIARGVTEAEGMLFRATVTEATRWTLDTDRVKAEMGTAWYEAHCKVGTSATVRVSARTGALKRAA
jgi:hypothetical protein